MTIVATASEAPAHNLRHVPRGRSFDVEITLTIPDSVEDNIVVIELPLPAGTAPLAGAESRNRTIFRETTPEMVRYLVQVLPGSGQRRITVRETIVSSIEGNVTFPGIRCYPLALPWQRSSTDTRMLRILPTGADDSEGYVFSADELYALGKLYYERGDFARAKSMLDECSTRWTLRQNINREVVLMLLNIAAHEVAVSFFPATLQVRNHPLISRVVIATVAELDRKFFVTCPIKDDIFGFRG